MFSSTYLLILSIQLELPGVVRVIPNSLHRLQTTRSWDFLGLSSHSPGDVLVNSSMGNGVIIGVLDTGYILFSPLCLYLLNVLVNLKLII